MSDSRFLAVEQATQQGRSWRELREFADFEPLIVTSAEDSWRRGLDASRCVAALVGRGNGRHSEVVTRLREHARRLPIVTFAREVGPATGDAEAPQACCPQHQATVVEQYPSNASACAFKKLARAADTWNVAPGATGCMEFFVERLLAGGPHGREDALR